MQPATLAFGAVLMAFAAYTVRDPRWWGHVFAYICRWSGLVSVVVGFAP